MAGLERRRAPVDFFRIVSISRSSSSAPFSARDAKISSFDSKYAVDQADRNLGLFRDILQSTFQKAAALEHPAGGLQNIVCALLFFPCFSLFDTHGGMTTLFAAATTRKQQEIDFKK